MKKPTNLPQTACSESLLTIWPLPVTANLIEVPIPSKSAALHWSLIHNNELLTISWGAICHKRGRCWIEYYHVSQMTMPCALGIIIILVRSELNRSTVRILWNIKTKPSLQTGPKILLACHGEIKGRLKRRISLTNKHSARIKKSAVL